MVITGSIVAFSIIGHIIFTPYFAKWWTVKHDNNDLNSFYLLGIGVFYGITLGLIAVSSWDNFQDVEKRVTEESVALAALYRDCNSLPSPYREELTDVLKWYTRYTIDTAWVKQRQGVVPTAGIKIVNRFQHIIYNFNPSTQRENNIHIEILRQFNRYIELRELRLSTVGVGLPTVLWMLLLFGALVNIVAAWMFVPETKIQGYFLNTMYSLTIGIMIFAIATLDNPFRGDVSVTPDAFEHVYEHVMTASYN